MSSHKISNHNKMLQVERFNREFWSNLKTQFCEPEYQQYFQRLKSVDAKLFAFTVYRAHGLTYGEIDNLNTKLPKLWRKGGQSTSAAVKLNRAAIAYALNYGLLDGTDFKGYTKALRYYQGVAQRNITKPFHATEEA